MLLIMMFNQAIYIRKCWSDDIAETEKYELNDLAKNVTELKKFLEKFCGIEASSEEISMIAYSIRDWVDGDKLYSLPGIGAEDDWYEAHDQGYECKDAPFESVNELSLIRGLRIEEGDSEEEIERKKNILDIFKQHVYIPPKDNESPKDDAQPILSDNGCFINITSLMISP